MEFIVKSLNDLSAKQLFEIYKLRSDVFIVEQNCAYSDVDDIDLVAKHFLIMDKDALAAYARLIPPGVSYKEPSIGRVVVKKEFRGKDLGKLLMQQCIDQLQESYPGKDSVISAQSYLNRFYTELGFIAEGKEYLEDNIPHIKMRLTGG